MTFGSRIGRATSVIVGSFTINLRAFIVKSGGYSIAACLAPLPVIVLSKEVGRIQVTSRFFKGGRASTMPPIMLKTTRPCCHTIQPFIKG